MSHDNDDFGVEEMFEEEEIVLVDDEGVEHNFVLVDVVMVDDVRYALLAPQDDEDDDDGAYLFRIVTEDGEDRLEIVEDDEEFDRVVAVLDGFDEDNHVHGPDCDHDH